MPELVSLDRRCMSKLYRLTSAFSLIEGPLCGTNLAVCRGAVKPAMISESFLMLTVDYEEKEILLDCSMNAILYLISASVAEKTRS